MNSLFHLNAFFEYGFLGRALLAGLLTSVTCGLLSPFVVLRRLAFSADGLAHASLGGLAVGLFVLGNSQLPTLFSYLISFVFTCGVAVDTLDCRLLAGLAAVAGVFCFLGWRGLGQWTFDEELAQASGGRVTALRYLLMLLIAATVILSTKVVGVLLVTALLILPGAVGTLSGRSLPVILLLSLLTALSSAATGMVFSNLADVPPGPAIVLAAFGLFLIAFFLRRHRDLQTSCDGP